MVQVTEPLLWAMNSRSAPSGPWKKGEKTKDHVSHFQFPAEMLTGIGCLRTPGFRLQYAGERSLLGTVPVQFTRFRRALATSCAASSTRKNKEKVIVISGPTGAGKSRLALELAKRLNGEIVSADSVQVNQFPILLSFLLFYIYIRSIYLSCVTGLIFYLVYLFLTTFNTTLSNWTFTGVVLLYGVSLIKNWHNTCICYSQCSSACLRRAICTFFVLDCSFKNFLLFYGHLRWS